MTVQSVVLVVVMVVVVMVIVVVVMVVIVVMIEMVIVVRRIVLLLLAVGRGCGMMVIVFAAQAPDRYAGVRRPARAAHALHRGPVMIVLARRQAAALHQK